MNCIVLEGFSLYLVLFLILLLVLISFACLVYAVFADKRIFVINQALKTLLIKNELLIKANMRLKLKYGEFDIDD